MNPDLVEAARELESSLLGPVEVHETIDSTNDEAFRRAQEGAPDGLVVLAGHQTGGKGRLGRTWFDLPDRSIMFSILLRPPIPVSSYPLLSLGMASAIAWASEPAVRLGLARSAERTAGRMEIEGDLTIKWPNDVLYRGKKLAGVLAESRSLRPGEQPTVVVGAGWNVDYGPDDFPEEIRSRATSLRIVSGHERLPVGWLFSCLMFYFAGMTLVNANRQDLDQMLARVARFFPKTGSRVKVTRPDEVIEGDLIGLTKTGALRLRNARTGEEETLTSGVMQ